ncbi:MAG: PhoH family protein, partial [Giesbergeria sp.]|nr:PhoH family protein [Giesbergeria sp.]
MPLPPAPTRRAALLNQDAFDHQAAPRSRRSSAQTAEPLASASPAVALLPSAAPETAPAKARARRPAPPQAAPQPAAPQAVARAEVPAPPAPTATSAAARPARERKKRGTGPKKLFVLDTNVLLHDPTSLFRFEEHDIYLPMIVLEELDGHKKGMTEVARNGRQVSRSLDALVATPGADIALGIALDSTGQRAAGGCLFFQTSGLDFELPTSLPPGKADNQILGVVEGLRKHHPGREVVLVSKDINMRVKARALGLPAEDYQNDKALEDGD